MATGLPGYPVGPGELIQGIVAIEASKTGVFFTTKWRIRLIVDGDVVDVSHPSHNATGKVQAAGHIPGEHGAGQAILAGVSQLQGMNFVFCDQQRQQWPEGFIARQFLIGAHLTEYMGWQYQPGCLASTKPLEARALGRIDVVDLDEREHPEPVLHRWRGQP